MDPRDDRSLGTVGPRATPVGRFAAAAAAATCAYWLPALAQPLPAVRKPLGVFDSTPDGRGCALTFDDGPHAQGTPLVLEALAERGAVATFFLVGEQVARNPGLAREIVAAGHRIGLHCDRHRNMLRLTPWQVQRDIDLAQARIEDETGVAIELYRPPYGIFNLAALLRARRSGWRPLLWTQWGRDWEAKATPESIAELAGKGLSDGSVILLHDADDYGAPGSWRGTVDSLPLLFERLDQAGLELVAA